MNDGQVRDGITKLDRELDAVLADWLQKDCARMRRDGVSEDQIEEFTRMKRETFEATKQFALCEVISFATGRPIVRGTLQ